MKLRKGKTMIDLKTIGARCKEYRLTLGVLQYKVAQDTGYSMENVSSFETGRNDNARILLWYFTHGMSIDYLMNGGGE